MSSIVLALATAFGLTLAYGWSRGTRSTRQFSLLIATGMLIAGLVPLGIIQFEAGMAGVLLLAAVLFAFGIVAVHLADNSAKGTMGELSSALQQAARLDLRVVANPASPEAKAAAEALAAL